MRSTLLGIAMTAANATPAFAHIDLTYPKPRPGGPNDIKTAPCGKAGSTRSSTINEFEPGTEITVTWDETVPHAGHYRISFDDSGQDFAIPKTVETANGSTVLADGIPDPADDQDKFSQKVKLPNIECDNCTLQLIQVMSTAASNWPASSMYFECADITLRRGAPAPTNPDGGAGGGSPDAGSTDDPAADDPAAGGCNAGGMPGILLALAAVPAWWRRRR